MKRRNLFPVIGAAVAAAFVPSRSRAAEPQIITGFAKTPFYERTTTIIGNSTTTVYTVTNPVAFPGLPLPNGALIARGGQLQFAGIDYNVTIGENAAMSFRFIPKIELSIGDTIGVVVP